MYTGKLDKTLLVKLKYFYESTGLSFTRLSKMASEQFGSRVGRSLIHYHAQKEGWVPYYKIRRKLFLDFMTTNLSGQEILTICEQLDAKYGKKFSDSILKLAQFATDYKKNVLNSRVVSLVTARRTWQLILFCEVNPEVDSLVIYKETLRNKAFRIKQDKILSEEEFRNFCSSDPTAKKILKYFYSKRIKAEQKMEALIGLQASLERINHSASKENQIEAL